MSETKTLQKITSTQITKNGVQALATRPNNSAQYGQGGLSPLELKLWFDKLATFLAGKINEIQDAICGEEAESYIRVVLDDYGVKTMKDLTEAFTSGDFANKILKLYPSASAMTKQTLQVIINSLAAQISSNDTDIANLGNKKLDKVTATNTYKRAYIIMPDGSQATVLISESPLAGAIPLYNAKNQLFCAIPTAANGAANKGYTDAQDLLLGSQIDLTIDKSTYKMKAVLKNFEGTVLSESKEIDLPLEQMIIKGSYNAATKKLTLTLRNNQEGVDNNSIEIDISDLIDGLVSETRTINGKPLSGDIVLSAADVGAYKKSETYSMSEIDQKEIYAHAAFWAEESENARNYTKGGGIDRKFRLYDNLLAAAGFSIGVSLNTSNYQLTISLKNSEGKVLSSDMVDLPIGSLISNGSYKNGILTLTLQSGSVINIDVSSLISGLVADSRKINGKPLTADIVLTAADVGAAASGDVYKKMETYSNTEINKKVSDACQELRVTIENEHQSVGSSYYSVEAEKAAGYTKGGEIDKAIKSINERLTNLENNNQ